MATTPLAAKLDFYGESTFRGWFSGQERDNPVRAIASNPDIAANAQPPLAPTATTTTDPADGSGNHANVPRRVIERLLADSGIAASHQNFAVSGTTSSVILNGYAPTANPTGYVNPLPSGIATVSGGSDGHAVVINTGINDALNGLSLSGFQANMTAILTRAIRTGKLVFVVRPNAITSGTAGTTAALLASYYDNFQAWLNSLPADISGNVVYIPTTVSAAAPNGDGTHPLHAGYETLRWQTVNGMTASGKLVVAPRQRLVAELYIMLFNRAPEAEGMGYWTGELATKLDTEVAQIMYAVAPGQAALDYPALVEVWYQNLFSAPPDAGGKAYWVNELNTTSPGVTAIKMLHAVRNQVGTTHKLMLTHRANVGVTHGALLKRTSQTFGLTAVTTNPASVYAVTTSI